MAKQVDLSNLPRHKTGLIKAIKLNNILEERLHKFGFIKGVKVRLIKASPFGSPKIYILLNTFVSLRDKIAERILVEVIDD